MRIPLTLAFFGAFSAVIALFGGVPRANAMAVEDPNQQGKVLQDFFPSAGASGFVCGQPLSFAQTMGRCDIQCTDKMCRNDCAAGQVSMFQVEAENCTDKSVDIVSSLSWEAQVHLPGDGSFGQTWLKDFLESTDFFIVPTGTMRISIILKEVLASLVDANGDEQSIPTAQVIMEYVQGPGLQTVEFELDLQGGKTGLEQILYFGDTDGKAYFIKRWGYLRWNGQ